MTITRVFAIALVLAACTAFLLLSPRATAAVPSSTLADYRIRDPNKSPALGRGYSMSTSDVLSTCLAFTAKTEPTYNYNYDYLEFDTTGSSTSDVSSSFSGSLSWGFIRATVSGNLQQKRSTTSSKRHLVVKMAMERYYSSIDDTTAFLTSDAADLVQRDDIVGFFQSCGSGYIRSIRRTAEFVGIFEIESKSEAASRDMATSLRLRLFGRNIVKGGVDLKQTSTSTETSVKIYLKAFGLGLNKDGDESLVSMNLEDFIAAAKYAFHSMQNDDVGMIHGVEVVSWAENLQFNNLIRFADQEVIEYAADGSRSVKTTTVVAADGTTTESPVMVSGVEVKAVTMINAEFITALQSFYRKQLNTVTMLLSCVGAVRSMYERGEANRYLLDHTRMEMGPEMAKQNSITIEAAYGLLTDEQADARLHATTKFINLFYGPCATQITRYSNNGRMTKYWWEIPECTPSGAGSEPGGLEQFSTKCLQSGREFAEIDGHHQVVCNEQGNFGDKTYGIDMFIEKFCMPEIDHSIAAAA